MTLHRPLASLIAVAATLTAAERGANAGYQKFAAAQCQPVLTSSNSASPHLNAPPSEWQPSQAFPGLEAGIVGSWVMPGYVGPSIPQWDMMCALPSDSDHPINAWGGMGVHFYNPWDVYDYEHGVKFRDCVIFEQGYGGYCGAIVMVQGQGHKQIGQYVGTWESGIDHTTNHQAWNYYPNEWPYIFVRLPASQDSTHFTEFRGFAVFN